MIISRTPFRASFFGGGTDFPEYYTRYSGATLLTTIDKYAYISLHKLSPFFRHRYIGHYAKTEHVIAPSEFSHPLIRECLLYLNIEEGLEISHVADLPGRTGLGSSSSFTVGLLHALHTYRGEVATRGDLAREAIAVERDRVDDPGGHQDQFAAAFGGLIRLDFRGDAEVSVKELMISPERRTLLENHLVLFYTGVEGSAQEILEEQRENTKRNLETLHRMAAMVDEAEEILCSDTDLLAFGDLLHESWQLKKGLSSGITNPLIDNAYEKARKVGARGGKLLGAGGRGFLLLFATPERHEAIRHLFPSFQQVRFCFSREGSQIIFEAPE
jgi:D-glycero-alpha-D-manno-heptose-7-phosphate kinase